MSEQNPVTVEEVLNSFTEVMSALMIDQYQKHIAELDLTFPQAQALRILRRGAVPTGQLAGHLKISAPAITQLTDRLVRKDLIERTARVDDRRCVIVALSTRGRKLVDEFRQRRRDIFSRALVQLTRQEQEQVTEALGKVVAALEELEAGKNAEGDTRLRGSQIRQEKSSQRPAAKTAKGTYAV